MLRTVLVGEMGVAGGRRHDVRLFESGSFGYMYMPLNS